MPFDPDKLKQVNQSFGNKPTTSKQARGFDANKLEQVNSGQVSPEEETAFRQGAVDFAKRAALPTALGMAGTAVGGMTGPLAPVAMPFLGGAGAMAGEYANQQLGITEEDPRQIALQGAVPLGLGALQKLNRLRAPLSGGGAEFLNRVAAPEMESRIAALRGPSPAPLFNRVAQSGASFDTGSTVPTIQAALKDLTTGSTGSTQYGRTIGILQGLEQKLQQSGGKLSPAEYQAELRDLGAAMRTAEGRTINQVEAGAIQKVYGALADSLDQEAGSAYVPPPIRGNQMLPPPMNGRQAAAQDLLDARNAVKREGVLDELEASVNNANKILRGQGGNVQFNSAAVLRDLQKNPFWNGTKGGKNPAFTPAEKADIEGLLKMLNEIPALQPGAGQAAGSYQIAKSLRSGLAAGAIGGAGSHDPVIAGASTLAGMAAPAVAEFGRVLSLAMRTQTGRDEIRNLLRQPGASMQSIVQAMTMAAPSAASSNGQQMPTMSMPVPFTMEQ